MAAFQLLLERSEMSHLRGLEDAGRDDSMLVLVSKAHSMLSSSLCNDDRWCGVSPPWADLSPRLDKEPATTTWRHKSEVEGRCTSMYGAKEAMASHSYWEAVLRWCDAFAVVSIDGAHSAQRPAEKSLHVASTIFEVHMR